MTSDAFESCAVSAVPKLISRLIVLLTILLPFSAQADYLGLTAGYPASVKEHKNRSVDVGMELFDNYQFTAVRLNRKFQKKWIGSAHLGVYGEQDASGFSTGIGAMYSLTDDKDFKKKFQEKFKTLGKRWHLGVRGSAAIAGYEQNERSLGAFSAKISLVGSTKNRPRDEKLLKWYADAGLQISNREKYSSGAIRSDTRLNLALTGGIIYPFLIIGETVYGNQYGGEVFGALSLSNGPRLAVGFRYNLK